MESKKGSKALEHVLLSWIGQRDLDAAHNNSDGPILATIRALRPDKVYLLFNYSEEKVDPYLSWLRLNSACEVDARQVNLRSPVDYVDIYKSANSRLREVWKAHANARRSILISPGTPAMQAIWILLGKTQYPAEFVQSSPEKGVQEVHLPFSISAEFEPPDTSAAGRQLRELLVGDIPDTAGFELIITGHKKLMEIKRRAGVLARFDVPVLILGESGTGKELFARAIHNMSGRSKRPFVALNCGAIPPDLIDSTLFGHVKGAFTGAVRDSPGVFEQANHGTLFLDELGELSKPAQVRLLRVLQEGRIVQVGAQKEQYVDVRLISATHRDLHSDIAERTFREDLYYRIAVGVLELPPLRERHGDLHRLTNYFLSEIWQQLGFDKDPSLTPSAFNILLRHTWPGNVRELRAVLLRAALWSADARINDSVIEGALLLRRFHQTDVLNRPLGDGFNLNALLGEVERHYLERAMLTAEGSKTKASHLLGFRSHQVLTTRLRNQGLDQSFDK